MKTLKRFWFTFASLSKPSPLNVGCGITAYDYDDAINILSETVFAGRELPAIKSSIEDVDVSTLDQNHVIPNMGLVTVRGVWFPQGFDV